MSPEPENPPESRPAEVPAGSARLQGELTVPAGARGLVLFAHGSGSSRMSPRNRFVAGELAEGGLATLLFDLLTYEEDMADRHSGRYRFDIELLAERLVGAVDWVGAQPRLAGLGLGLFGASTGAAAALMAAAERPDAVRAVVSRGGRPDLAEGALSAVRAPTLLIVGENDPEVVELNRRAFDALDAEKSMRLVPGATHLFEEPGTLVEVARLALLWFEKHLGSGD